MEWHALNCTEPLLDSVIAQILLSTLRRIIYENARGYSCPQFVLSYLLSLLSQKHELALKSAL